MGSADEKADSASPKIVVECKAESVSLNLKDYYQGESYARSMGAEFFVAHNRRFTEPFEVVPAAPGKFKSVVRIPAATDWGDAKKIKAIKSAQRAFNRVEFTRLLQTSHDIIRDVHKKDPTVAFDAISKVLFIKMFVERSGLHGTFTTESRNEPHPSLQLPWRRRQTTGCRQDLNHPPTGDRKPIQHALSGTPPEGFFNA